MQSGSDRRQELERQVQSIQGRQRELERQVEEGERSRQEMQGAAQQGKAAEVQVKALQARLAQATQAAATIGQDLAQARTQVLSPCFPTSVFHCSVVLLTLQQVLVGWLCRVAEKVSPF